MVIAILITACLLGVGSMLRGRIRVARWLHLPSSLIAGFLALLCVQAVLRFQPGGGSWTAWAQQLSVTWSGWPGPLIAVVFAGMLLEREPLRFGDAVRRAGREGLMVWIIVLGETAIGLLAVWLLLNRTQPTPAAYGMLIETGFAGGHGTAAAMGQVFRSPVFGLPAGRDLGIMMATIGLVYGVVSGVLWANLGIRCGWTGGFLNRQPSRARETTSQPTATSDSRRIQVFRLAAAVACIALAYALGWAFQTATVSAAELFSSAAGDASAPSADPVVDRMQAASIVSSFPLFIYTLFGGWVVRRVLSLVRRDHLVDAVWIRRLTTISMDGLIVAAIGSLNLAAVAGHFGLIANLVLIGASWTAICLLVLSRHILPRDHWFELGLINYGMSTGTTATGFILLRMIDPELRSGAAEEYAWAAPLSSPFIGGGILTFAIPLLLLDRFSIAWVATAVTAAVASLIAIGIVSRSDRGVR